MITGVKGISNDSEDVLKYRHEAWQALAKLQKDGLIRSIGVSNFVVKHLKELKNVSNIVPSLNQVEWHPKSRDYDLLNYCKDNNIVLQAYSSLGSYNTTLRNDPKVSQIAVDLEKSPSQVLLRWASQNGIAIIPKATSKKHMDENMNLNFVIPEIHMETLNGFEQLVSLFNRSPSDII